MNLRPVVLLVGLALVAGVAASMDSEFGITADVELNGFMMGVVSADNVVAPNGESFNATGSGRIALRPTFGNTLSAFVAAEGWLGEGFDPLQDLVVLEPVNADIALEAPMVVSEAYASLEFGDGNIVRISGGKVDISSLFDVSDIAGDQRTQFINSRFRNSSAIAYPGGVDAPRAISAWVEFENAGRWLQCTAGWAKMARDSDDSYFFGEARAIAGVHLVAGLYGWQANGLLPEWGGGAPSARAGGGVFVDYEPRITGDAKVFGRLSFADQTTSLYKASWSLGASVGGGPWGRPNDTVGIAFGVNALSDDYAAFTATANDANEAAFEAYYRLMLLIADSTRHWPSIEVTPNVQMVMNAGGIDGQDTAAVAGVRVRSVLRF